MSNVYLRGVRARLAHGVFGPAGAVWRVVDLPPWSPTSGMRALKRMILHWMDSLQVGSSQTASFVDDVFLHSLLLRFSHNVRLAQLRVPGASMLLVGACPLSQLHLGVDSPCACC